ncbi:NAD(P)-binding domain-containing protein [Catenisphaera adipataccumulans]|uniref:Glycerol-3-phosphate dehydrogenase n=1 Tax=Catenisphaera adipataccumulans TaxID=700500 RepID=A0A7W8FVU2_9FIRM|nr:NAD(P)-binding domain-containing protein [Catenisphaera adipataccumulans]MBB5183954.1 glycerol-3-phosphate dehydrogenase (NAD(P)+) [Catenisphaera adipataccumulans]
MAILTFIGAGQMASGLTFPAFENGHEIRLVGTPLDRKIIDRLRQDNYHLTLDRTLHDGIHYYQVEEMEKAIEGADVIIGGVSSFGVDWFADEVLPKLHKNVPVITVTKGMIDEPDGNMVDFPDYWQSTKAGKDLNLNAIGGPCTARELSDHDQTWVAFCGRDKDTLHKLKAIFSTPYYHISLSNDVKGVELSVALKNGYAMAVSLTIGLTEKNEGIGKVHHNSEAALFGQSVTEMQKLLKLAGVRDESLVFGVGDLYVTISGGRSRRIGVLLGRGYSYDEAKEKLKGETLEAVVIATRTARAVRAMAERGKADLKDFPLLLHVDEVINNGKPVNIPWQATEAEYFE